MRFCLFTNLARWIKCKVSLNTAVFLPQLERSKSQLACLLAVDAWPIDNIEVRGEFFAPATKVRELEQIAKLCQKRLGALLFSSRRIIL